MSETKLALVSYEQFCWLLDLGFTLKFNSPAPPYIRCVRAYVDYNPPHNRGRNWCFVYYQTQEPVTGGMGVSNRRDMFQQVKTLSIVSFEPQKLQEKS